MNLPNKLTLLRFVLVPVFMVFMYLDNPYSYLIGLVVFAAASFTDYLDGSIFVAGLGKVDKTPFAGSNVLYFELNDGCTFIIRPSGTEPKIKVYLLVRGESREQCSERMAAYSAFAEELSK